MKRFLIAALALLAGSFAAFGQEDTFRKTFSLAVVKPSPIKAIFSCPRERRRFSASSTPRA